MATPKKRAPIEQLRQAGRLAREMLVDKGIIAKDSVLDELMKVEGAPKLPGLPHYLPHQWTIKAAQQIMYDLLIMWREQCGKNEAKKENITEFFKFVVRELRKIEKKYAKEVKEMPLLLKNMKNVPVLKEVFAPIQKKENINAINRFFIDSFAVAIVLENNHSTSEYANWFLDWSQDLHSLWVKPEKRKEITRV